MDIHSPTFTNADIDRTATMIQYIPVEAVRDELVLWGLSEYDAYLCYKAAKLLLDSGLFYPRQGRRPIHF